MSVTRLICSRSWSESRKPTFFGNLRRSAIDVSIGQRDADRARRRVEVEERRRSERLARLAHEVGGSGRQFGRRKTQRRTYCASPPELGHRLPGRRRRAPGPAGRARWGPAPRRGRPRWAPAGSRRRSGALRRSTSMSRGRLGLRRRCREPLAPARACSRARIVGPPERRRSAWRAGLVRARRRPARRGVDAARIACQTAGRCVDEQVGEVEQEEARRLDGRGPRASSARVRASPLRLPVSVRRVRAPRAAPRTRVSNSAARGSIGWPFASRSWTTTSRDAASRCRRRRRSSARARRAGGAPSPAHFDRDERQHLLARATRRCASRRPRASPGVGPLVQAGLAPGRRARPAMRRRSTKPIVSPSLASSVPVGQPGHAGRRARPRPGRSARGPAGTA